VKVGRANAEAYQAGEKRDLPARLGRDAASFPPVRSTCLRADAHRQAQTGVIATYRMYASFLRIRRAFSHAAGVACISSFFTGLSIIPFIQRLL